MLRPAKEFKGLRFNNAGYVMGRRLFISRNCQVEYLELAKCACTSIKTALLTSDGVTPRCHDLDNEKHWQHVLGSRPPTRCRFTFIRHPFTRFISAYRQKCQKGYLEAYDMLHRSATPHAFACWIENHLRENDWPDKHFAPQSQLLNNRLRVCEHTLIGRVENINEDWSELQSRFGLPPLPCLNTSKGVVDLDEQTLAKVYSIYEQDFLIFGYSLKGDH